MEMETPKWAEELAEKSTMKIVRRTSCGCPVLEDYDRFVEIYDSVPYTPASADRPSPNPPRPGYIFDTPPHQTHLTNYIGTPPMERRR